MEGLLDFLIESIAKRTRVQDNDEDNDASRSVQKGETWVPKCHSRKEKWNKWAHLDLVEVLVLAAAAAAATFTTPTTGRTVDIVSLKKKNDQMSRKKKIKIKQNGKQIPDKPIHLQPFRVRLLVSLNIEIIHPAAESFKR